MNKTDLKIMKRERPVYSRHSCLPGVGVIVFSLLFVLAGALPSLAKGVDGEWRAGMVVSVGDDPEAGAAQEGCVFDTLFPVFRQLFRTFDSLRVEKATSNRLARQRATSYAQNDSPLAGRIRLYDPFTPANITGNTRYFISMYDQFYERISRDSVEAILLPVIEAVHARPGFSVKAEKERLASRLEAFADTATVALPTVYGLIASKYHGDVRAYVDDLFDHSVMTSKRQLKRFMRSPYVRQMEKDMGFQFAVSKLLYRLWVEQGCPVQPGADGSRLVIMRSELPSSGEE